MSNVFLAPVHLRYRDLNPGRHVDAVECMRLMDEARQHFLRFADLPEAPGRGLYSARPDGIVDLMAAQRAEYRSEVMFTGYEAVQVSVWLSRVGGSSIELSTELRMTPEATPSVVGLCTMVQMQRDGAPWALDDDFRAVAQEYLGERVALRG